MLKKDQGAGDRAEVELDDLQRRAVLESVKNGLLILSGGTAGKPPPSIL